MKYFFLTFLLLASLTSNPLSVKAGGGGGAATGGSTEITQILNLGELLSINISDAWSAASDAITAAATEGLFIDETILDPIANQLISNMVEQVSKDIFAWASGGFQGEPLLISNPESYITKQGLSEVKKALGGIPNDSIFGDSIFSNILDQYQNNDLKSKLAELSKSNIPSLLQNNLCTDETLTDLAEEDVASDGGEYTESEVIIRKQELFNYACQGDPNTDPQIAARLQDIQNQKPGVGGWDTWLAMTAGDNQYTRSTEAIEAVQQSVQEEEDLARRELFDGLGAISQRTCVRTEPTADGYDSDCVEWSTDIPGDLVNSTLSKAATAGMDRLSNLLGSGSLSGILTNLATSLITSGLSGAFSGSTGSSGGGSSNTSTTINTVRPVSQDLLSDPARRDEFTRPMKRQFDTYLESLSNLERVDNLYLTDFITYEAKIATGRTCYNNLLTQSGTIFTSSEPRISAAFNFYTNRQGTLNSIKTRVTAEVSKINEARNLINTTISKINASNSSQEISTIFNAYSASLDSGGYPSINADGQRNAEYRRDKINADRDKDLDNYQSTCNQMQQEVTNYNNSFNTGGGYQ